MNKKELQKNIERKIFILKKSVLLDLIYEGREILNSIEQSEKEIENFCKSVPDEDLLELLSMIDNECEKLENKLYIVRYQLQYVSEEIISEIVFHIEDTKGDKKK